MPTRSQLSSDHPAVENRPFKSLNRMNDLVEGCKITGNVLLDGEDIYKGMDVNLFTKKSRHGIPEAKSVPDEYLRQYAVWTENPWYPLQSKIR